MARKQNLEATIESNRPPTSAGRLDQSLAGLALALRGVVAETQEMFIYPACQLDNDSLDELAVALVEFAEDIHAGIGLWQALENYQSEFFGTPLPLFLDVGEPLSGRFDPRRVRHFLYILWRQLKPDLILAPDHRDLTELAETLSEFLAAAFRQQPKDSGVARFLQGRVAEFQANRLLRQVFVQADPSADLALAADGTTYVSRYFRGVVSVSRLDRSGRDLGTVSLGPAILSQLRTGASSAYAELLPLDAWVRVPAGDGEVTQLAPITGLPLPSKGGRLLRVGTERFIRLGLVRHGRVQGAVELRSAYRFGEVALAEPDGSGGYVAVARVWRPRPAADQFQVIHISNGRLVETFAVDSRGFAASPPMSRFRLGRNGRLYQLVTDSSGIRIVEFELKEES